MSTDWLAQDPVTLLGNLDLWSLVMGSNLHPTSTLPSYTQLHCWGIWLCGHWSWVQIHTLPVQDPVTLLRNLTLWSLVMGSNLHPTSTVPSYTQLHCWGIWLCGHWSWVQICTLPAQDPVTLLRNLALWSLVMGSNLHPTSPYIYFISLFIFHNALLTVPKLVNIFWQDFKSQLKLRVCFQAPRYFINSPLHHIMWPWTLVKSGISLKLRVQICALWSWGSVSLL